MSNISKHFEEAYQVLEAFNTESNFLKIEEAGLIMVESLKKGGKIISCGNGGSMCDAMHFAEELSGRYRGDRKALAAVSISDSSHISCVANDYGYDFVFERYIEAFGKEGDVLLAISTSGNSKNVNRALISAKENGIVCFGFLGSGGGSSSQLCDQFFLVPSSDTARIQESHITAGHVLMELIENILIESKFITLR